MPGTHFEIRILRQFVSRYFFYSFGSRLAPLLTQNKPGNPVNIDRRIVGTNLFAFQQLTTNPIEGLISAFLWSETASSFKKFC
jgi:hypothetical protein